MNRCPHPYWLLVTKRSACSQNSGQWRSPALEWMLAKTIWHSYLECRVIFIRKLLVSVIRLWLIKRLKIQIRSVFLHHLFQCSRHTFKCGSFNWLVLPTIWHQLISEKTKVRFIVFNCVNQVLKFTSCGGVPPFSQQGKIPTAISEYDYVVGNMQLIDLGDSTGAKEFIGDVSNGIKDQHLPSASTLYILRTHTKGRG